MEILSDTSEMELPSFSDSDDRATDGSVALSGQLDVEPVIEEGQFPSVDTYWGD